MIDNTPKARLTDFKVSEHFTLFELTRTDRKDFQFKNRILSDHQVYKLMYFCEFILEPIRRQFRLPVMINSGYRCQELNEDIGGVVSSQHLFCEAADIYVKGLDDREGIEAVFNWIAASKLPFGQVIYEVRGTGDMTKRWIHVSIGQPYRVEKSCGQVLKIVKKN